MGWRKKEDRGTAEINKLIYVKHLKQCLAYSKNYVSVNYYRPPVPQKTITVAMVWGVGEKSFHGLNKFEKP